MKIKQRIRERRKDNKLTQEKLAEIIGVSLMTLKRWEWGDSAPRAEELQKLAEALNTTSAYLLGETDNPEYEAPKAEQTKNASEFTPTTVTQERGMLSYELGNGRRLQVPDTPENAVQFWARVDRLIGLQPQTTAAV